MMPALGFMGAVGAVPGAEAGVAPAVEGDFSALVDESMAGETAVAEAGLAEEAEAPVPDDGEALPEQGDEPKVLPVPDAVPVQLAAMSVIAEAMTIPSAGSVVPNGAADDADVAAAEMAVSDLGSLALADAGQVLSGAAGEAEPAVESLSGAVEPRALRLVDRGWTAVAAAEWRGGTEGIGSDVTAGDAVAAVVRDAGQTTRVGVEGALSEEALAQTPEGDLTDQQLQPDGEKLGEDGRSLASAGFGGTAEASEGKARRMFDKAANVRVVAVGGMAAQTGLSEIAEAPETPEQGLAVDAAEPAPVSGVIGVETDPQAARATTVSPDAAPSPSPGTLADRVSFDARIEPPPPSSHETTPPKAASDAPHAMRSPLVQAAVERIGTLPAVPGETVLRLNPHGLGIIEVVLNEGRDGVLDVALRVQNPLVLEAMRQEQAAVAQALSAMQGGATGSLSMDLFQPGTGQRGGEHTPREARAAASDTGADPAAEAGPDEASSPVLRADRVNILT